MIEVIEQSPLLAICGAGPVGQAVAHNAHLCGFELLVADDREEFRRPELFPPGTRFLAVTRDFDETLDTQRAGQHYVAVVSRCWETDLAALQAVLRDPPPHLVYLGLMGSERKVERVRAELIERGFDPEGAGLRGPIGLQIGGETPAEIAVSILAEMIQTRCRGNPEREWFCRGRIGCPGTLAPLISGLSRRPLRRSALRVPRRSRCRSDRASSRSSETTGS